MARIHRTEYQRGESYLELWRSAEFFSAFVRKLPEAGDRSTIRNGQNTVQLTGAGLVHVSTRWSGEISH